MKTKVAILSLILLAACGGGSDSSAAPAPKTDPVAQQEQPQPQQEQPKEEEKMEEKKDPSIDYFEYLDLYSDTYKPPYEVPSWDHEPRRDGDTYPSLSLQKFINLGIVRIINENKMVEGALADVLKAEMADMTFDRAMTALHRPVPKRKRRHLRRARRRRNLQRNVRWDRLCLLGTGARHRRNQRKPVSVREQRPLRLHL